METEELSIRLLKGYAVADCYQYPECPEQLKTFRSISCVAIGWVETQSGMLEFSRIQNSYTRITGHFLWMHWEKMS